MNNFLDWFNRYTTPIATAVSIVAVYSSVSKYLSSVLDASAVALLLLCFSLLCFRKAWTRSLYRVTITSPVSGSLISQAQVQVRGRFAFKSGLKIGLFHKRGTKYCPQEPIKFNDLRKEWDGVVIVDGVPNARYDIVIASYSPQLEIAFDHYGVVGHKKGVWEAVDIPDNLRGFCILDHIYLNFVHTVTPGPVVASIKGLN